MINKENQLPRTRIIPIGDFYTRLELEYISYKFRSLIYQRPFDKKKFSEICEKKKEKIDQIALENCLPSIFKEVETQKRYLIKFLNKSGLPNFCYRDDYQTSVKGRWDKYYYFVVGSSVKLTIDNEIEIGQIVSNDIKEENLIVRLDGRKVVVKYCDAVRIFPSDFFEKLFK